MAPYEPQRSGSDDASGTKLRRAYMRVMALWLAALAGLWLLQSCYGGS